MNTPSCREKPLTAQTQNPFRRDLTPDGAATLTTHHSPLSSLLSPLTSNLQPLTPPPSELSEKYSTIVGNVGKVLYLCIEFVKTTLTWKNTATPARMTATHKSS